MFHIIIEIYFKLLKSNKNHRLLLGLALKGFNVLDDGYMPFEPCRNEIRRSVTNCKRLWVKMRIKNVDETWLIEKIFTVNALWNSQNSPAYASVSKEFEIP